MLKWFPMLFVPLVVYNLVALASPLFGGGDVPAILADAVRLTMFSGDIWVFTLGDFIVVLALVMLFVEVVKATRTTSIEIFNHGLSMAVFIIALVEFLVAKGFATSTFFLVVAMGLFDVVAGFTVSIVAAKRDLGTTGGLIGTN